MIRRTTSFIAVIAGLILASQQSVEAQIFARIPHNHEQQLPSRNCGPTSCQPRWAGYGYHQEVWRRWPGQEMQLEGLDLSPFATPSRKGNEGDAGFSVPDPRDEDAIASPPRNSNDAPMEMSPMTPQAGDTSSGNIPAPSISPPPESDETTIDGLPEGLEPDLPSSSPTDDLPDLGGDLDSGFDSSFPEDDSLDIPTEDPAPLDVPAETDDSSMDGFLDGLGQINPPAPMMAEADRANRRRTANAAQPRRSSNQLIGPRANPLRSLADESGAETNDSAVPATYESDVPQPAPRQGSYRPRRQTTMRGIERTPMRRGPAELASRPREIQDERYHEQRRPQELDYPTRRSQRRDATADRYARRVDPRGQHYDLPPRPYTSQRHDRYPEEHLAYGAPEYLDRRYDEAEYRARRDRYEVAQSQDRRLGYHRRPMVDSELQATEHLEPASEETTSSRSPVTGRVNPLRR